MKLSLPLLEPSLSRIVVAADVAVVVGVAIVAVIVSFETKRNILSSLILNALLLLLMPSCRCTNEACRKEFKSKLPRSQKAGEREREKERELSIMLLFHLSKPA